MQETEVSGDINTNELMTSGYRLELESNSIKSRVGFYITKNLNYIRRNDLEGLNSNVIIIDVAGDSTLRIINVYRTFTTKAGESQQSKFRYQLSIIRKAIEKNVKFMILGDFNLDYSHRNDVNYRYENMFNDFDDAFDDINLIQMVEFKTWSRVVNNVLRESIIDHIYVTDPTMLIDLQSAKPCFGDHLLIHKLNNRAMPNAIMLYKSAIQLFKLYNSNEHTYDWTLLNLNQILTSRQTHFAILKTNSTKVGINILANRLYSINGQIPLSWLNSSLNTFKLHCKRLLLCG